MKRVLYVDFENVSSAGLNGVLKLTKNDEVKIFLGPKCSKMSLIEAESILHCDATVELIKNDQIGKNALDFIIMVHLGYDIAKREGDAFFIISNDKGYEPAIHEMQSKTGETIERYPDIEHVITRNDEEVGFFARLFKKKPVIVENTTEHEVLRKGGRTTGGKNTGARTGNSAGRNAGGRSSSGARSGGNGSGPRNGSGAGRNVRSGVSNNSRSGSGNNRNSQKPAQGSGQTPEVAKKPDAQVVKPVEQVKKPIAQVNNPPVPAVKSAEQVKKPATTASTKPKAIVKASTKPGTPITITTQDDSYLDNLSIADLRAQLNVSSSASTSGATPSAVAMKSEKGAAIKPAQALTPAQPTAPKRPASPAPVDMTESERDLVSRALAETDNLGDFHNYILKELHDNDRATEIYKAEKHKVGKNK